MAEVICYPKSRVFEALSEVVMGKKLPKHAQVRMVGNSVPPGLARALVSANIPRGALRSEIAECA